MIDESLQQVLDDSCCIILYYIVYMVYCRYSVRDVQQSFRGGVSDWEDEWTDSERWQ